MSLTASKAEDSLKGQVSAEEWEARVNLAAAYRLVALYGWDDLVFTHISSRVPNSDHHFLINPYGMMFEEVTASSLVKIDADGNKIQDSPYDVNPAGFTIHSAIHAARDDAHCVMHTHSLNGVAVSTQKEGLLPISQQATLVLSNLGYHDYEGIAFDLSERERLARDLGDNKVLILKNHGLLTVGDTVAEAFMWMYRAERACRFQLAFQQAGAAPIEISEEMQQTTIERNRKANSKDGYRPIGVNEWPALLRKLDRENPGYEV